MGNYNLLVSCPLIQDSMDKYADTLADHGITYDIVRVDQQLDEPELLDTIGEYDAVIAGDDEFTRPVFEKAENLSLIVKWGIGTDNIDEAAARDHDVQVRNTPDVFGTEVSDVVMGYAIMLTRELHKIDRAVREGDWYTPRGVSLVGKTMGVVGVGDIGSAVARRADAHGMTVLGNDVEPIPDDLKSAVDISSAQKAEVFDESDIVSLNCPLTEKTRSLVGEEELDLLGSKGYLINTSRGKLIDQQSLVEALEKHRIAGAALDVFEHEPLPKSSPLIKMENVILGTHNAQNTAEAVSRTNDRAIDILVNERLP